jgi:hypothetical protein
LHVAAVFSAPWAIQLSDVFLPALPPGRIPRDAQGREIPPPELDPRVVPPLQPVLPQAIAGFFWHYTNLLYINNGYDFFSPDPSVSHLIDYEVLNASNQSIATGTLPDRRDQWPRLFYHRHMMLVEQSSNPGPVLADRGWEINIANRLLEVHGGARIHMVKKRHHLLTPEEVLAGGRLDDPSTYEVLSELDHAREGLQSAAATGALGVPGSAQ